MWLLNTGDFRFSEQSEVRLSGFMEKHKIVRFDCKSKLLMSLLLFLQADKGYRCVCFVWFFALFLVVACNSTYLRAWKSEFPSQKQILENLKQDKQFLERVRASRTGRSELNGICTDVPLSAQLNDPRCLVLFGGYTLGKEDFLQALLQSLYTPAECGNRRKIMVTAERMAVLESVAGGSSYLDTFGTDLSRFRIVELNKLRKAAAFPASTDACLTGVCSRSQP